MFSVYSEGNYMKLESILVSNTGLVRTSNEDNFVYFGKFNTDTSNDIQYLNKSCLTLSISFSIFDGMGGMNNGRKASFIAASEFLKYNFNAHLTNISICIEDYYMRTNKLICEFIRNNVMTRMGTTVVTLHFYENKVVFSNLGDSRLYLIRGNKLIQLSQDHSETGFLFREGLITEEQSNNHPGANKLTQHLGIFPEEFIIEPFIDSKDCFVNDIYVLATDGLTSYCSKNDILDFCISSDIEEASDRMRQKVIENGAPDNFTYIIIKVV